jgi:rhodanese-related sulfurtransferase
MTSALRLGALVGRQSSLLARAPARTGPARRLSAVVQAALRGEAPLPAAAAAGAALSAALSAAPARAQADVPAVDAAVGGIIDAIRAAGEAVKAGVGAAERGLGAAREAYAVVEPTVRSAADAAAPAVGAAARAANSVLAAAPAELERALAATGVDAEALAGAETAAGQAAAGARPLLEALASFVATAPPAQLAEAALGLAAAYYLLPAAARALAAAARGYAADVSPAAALAALLARGDAVLVDVRAPREKEAAGVPDVGNAGRVVELEFAAIADRRVRGQLRDAAGLEARATALQIAALRRLGKRTPVFLLDARGGGARAVARELAALGFSSVSVVKGGFANWARERLGVKLSTTVTPTVLGPGAGRFGAGGGGGGTRRELPAAPRRAALPAPRS